MDTAQTFTEPAVVITLDSTMSLVIPRTMCPALVFSEPDSRAGVYPYSAGDLGHAIRARMQVRFDVGPGITADVDDQGDVWFDGTGIGYEASTWFGQDEELRQQTAAALESMYEAIDLLTKEADEAAIGMLLALRGVPNATLTEVCADRDEDPEDQERVYWYQIGQ